jgi:hypothetical protein
MEIILRGMKLTPLDLKLLHYLHSVKVSTYLRIKRDIYPDYHIGSVCNRIYRLEDNRLVKGSCNRSIANGERVLSLTERGFKGFVADGTERRTELTSDSVEHDLGLVDLRFCIRSLRKVICYHTENEMQTWRQHHDAELQRISKLNSDAVIAIHYSSGKLLIPIEYESTMKSPSRYKDIVRKYYGSSDVVIAAYFCKNQEILNRIKAQEMNFSEGNEAKIVYALMQQSQENRKISLTSCSGQEISLD